MGKIQGNHSGELFYVTRRALSIVVIGMTKSNTLHFISYLWLSTCCILRWKNLKMLANMKLSVTANNKPFLFFTDAITDPSD